MSVIAGAAFMVGHLNLHRVLHFSVSRQRCLNNSRWPGCSPLAPGRVWPLESAGASGVVQHCSLDTLNPDAYEALVLGVRSVWYQRNIGSAQRQDPYLATQKPGCGRLLPS